MEEPRGPLHLSCSQGALQGKGQLTEGRQPESEVKMDSPDTCIVFSSKRQTPLTKAGSEIYLSDFSKKQRHDETLISDPEIMRQKKRKIKANEKKRRVPVNELALVPSLPTPLELSPAAEVRVIFSLGLYVMRGTLTHSMAKAQRSIYNILQCRLRRADRRGFGRHRFDSTWRNWRSS